jgi:RNA polymerase sigma-70 factor (ECF subfamily)
MGVYPRAELNTGEGSSPESTAEQDLPYEDTADQTLVLTGKRRAPNDKEWESDPGRLRSDSATRERILALYDEYRPRLFRYMRSMNLGRDVADEVIQETFMRLTAELLKENQIENVQGWIVRVAHNLAVDLLKKQREPNLAAETATFVIENRVDPSLSPEEAYLMKERFSRMNTALSTLKPLHRQCFQLRAQDVCYKDIGHAVGISEQRAAFIVKQVAMRLAASLRVARD